MHPIKVSVFSLTGCEVKSQKHQTKPPQNTIHTPPEKNRWNNRHLDILLSTRGSELRIYQAHSHSISEAFIKPDSGAQKVKLNAGTGCSGFSGLERKALKTRSLGKISDSIKKRSFSPIVDD
ncbi:hypothetical protein PGT21_031920 [Puccinia graminis f. sp. tritici]|uniref:Uncharacterized protein n=1 Tax=Puccinia graminis f. sp. tritici TaxID=56615 RepID=A0A5B0P783_PUCGR|nr:hypothetical protein PGT21_031920 [Puccinia graminis f. sp. tritici]KAA1107924.1 hypothetical protein PGTUg99_011218 [Puccinia graminis f. sp. tritici]